MTKPLPIESILAAVSSFLPAELSADIKKNVIGSVRSALENMDFVTRTEIEVQETVLRRARERISELESRIELLEAQMPGDSSRQ
ncbi:MAG: accessory factor UbiK family protein [Acidiferrobacterales bacterium]|nr:accessory factor UbiK family protein [Acidiferrobacterales bacterium]